MSSKVESNRTYIGVVEYNKDPKRVGRCRIRVLDIFDGRDKDGSYLIETKDLPWAFSWKDLNGNSYNLPEIGKVVTVVFESGNENNPEYIYAQHYNVNLENKLKDLSDVDYVSMKSLIYDHKTQIYVNDSEGLKIDHKFNNINIKESSININLKDNFGKINLGTQNSTQRAILGDNFTNWLDKFLDIMMGSEGGPFLGNLAAPVVATPALMAHIQLYQSIKDPKILSKNVYIVDNESVDTISNSSPVFRSSDGQIGDNWQSTVEDNKLTSKEEVVFNSIPGASSTTFDKPIPNSTDAVIASELAPTKGDDHPDVAVILELLKTKNYKLFTRPFEMNIISIRNQCLKSGDPYTDEFVDKLYALYKDNNDNWILKNYIFSTMPGVNFEVTKNWIDSKNFKGQESIYWNSKIGTKISLKDYYKGPII